MAIRSPRGLGSRPSTSMLVAAMLIEGDEHAGHRDDLRAYLMLYRVAIGRDSMRQMQAPRSLLGGAVRC